MSERNEDMESRNSENIASQSGWDERLLRPIQEGKWIECRNLGIVNITGSKEYSHRLTVAINWDGSITMADDGLAKAEETVVAALIKQSLCIYALKYLCDNEWDLVFYTNAPDEVLVIINTVQRTLPDVTLIPEIVLDRDWNYYRARINAIGRL